MTIKVWYSDETTETYNSIKEAEQGILVIVTGCNFACAVDSVAQIDENEDEGKYYSCNWSLRLEEIPDDLDEPVVT